jgi:Lrp/AsnC family leucine-responsive transcriptional regulator
MFPRLGEYQNMEKIDLAILGRLEADGRLSYAELGEAVGLSKSACWKRVQVLEQAGVIRGSRALIDPAAIGLDTIAFVSVTVAFDQHAAFEQASVDHRAILACYAILGEADYLLQVATPAMSDLDHFLRQELWRLPGVQRFNTTMAVRTIKRDGLMTRAAQRPA